MLYANVTFISESGSEDKGILFINNVYGIVRGEKYTHVEMGEGVGAWRIKETPEEIIKSIQKLEV